MSFSDVLDAVSMGVIELLRALLLYFLPAYLFYIFARGLEDIPTLAYMDKDFVNKYKYKYPSKTSIIKAYLYTLIATSILVFFFGARFKSIAGDEFEGLENVIILATIEFPITLYATRLGIKEYKYRYGQEFSKHRDYVQSLKKEN